MVVTAAGASAITRPGRSAATPRQGTPGAPTAQAALRRVVLRFAVFLRVSCAVTGAAAAVAVLGPPVRPATLYTVTVALLAWSGWFAWWALRNGLTPLLIGTDVLLTAGVCLLMPQLVPPAALPGEVSWIAILASTSVVLAQLAWPLTASVPAGLLLAVTYYRGADAAGDPHEATAHLVTLLVQTASAGALMLLVRRAGRGADAALAAAHEGRRRAAVAGARRDAERRLNRELHDTVLSTLTMVGLGAVDARSAGLRTRAAADLAMLREMAARPGPGTAECRVEQRLAALPPRVPGLTVRLDLAGCSAPVAVAAALAEAAAEALTNTARHAGTDRATVILRRHDATVAVQVVDDGRGFDPTAVPAHRYGLRESVHARMAAVGGRAEVVSAPGRGTTVRLEWTRDR